MDDNQFLESYLNIIEVVEGIKGGDTTTDIPTAAYGIVDTLGINPDDFKGNPRGLAKAVAAKNIDELKRIGVDWDNLPLSMKYNSLDMQFNLGNLPNKAKNYLNNLKSGNYAGALSETLDAIKAPDPVDNKQRPVKGIAKRRAMFYNIAAPEMGLSNITNVNAINQDNPNKSAKFTYALADGNFIEKPFDFFSLHSRSIEGDEPISQSLVEDFKLAGMSVPRREAEVPDPVTFESAELIAKEPSVETKQEPVVEVEESRGILDRLKDLISPDTEEEKRIKEITKQEPEILELPDELSEARDFSVLREMYKDKKFNAGGLSLTEQMDTLQDPAVKQAKRRAKERTTDKTNLEKLKDVAKFGAEFIPGVGEAMAVKRVSDAMDEKDYVGAGIETAAGALGVIPVVGDAAGKGLRKVFSRKEIEDASPSWFKETEVSKDIKPEDAQKTQITTTTSTYKKAKEILPEGKTLDFGAGKGVGAKEVGSDTYEPFPDKSFSPTYTDSKSIPSNSYDNITSLNVLNVVKPDVRSDIVQDIGRILKPNGTAIITTRGMDIFGNAKNPVKGILADEPRAVITSTGTYQKGFTPKELKEYIESELGENFEVTNVRDLGKAGVKVKKNLKSANVIETEKKSSSDIFEEMQRGFVDATLEGRKQASQKALNKFAEEGNLKEFKVGERILGKNKSFKITGYSAQGFSEEAMEKQIDQYQKLRKNQIEAGTLPEQPTYMLGEDGRYYRLSINVESDDGTKTQLYQDILAHQKKKNLDKFLSGLNLAEGGAVPMEKQMSMFEDGGLMDEGGTIDPISGNDVPPGSTQEEVRDDIPAQLSEGEFVFPADVVRYIGLEKLMQMRQEAKMGLSMMDKMGQMGNADEAVIPDDIPFELSDLDMEDEPVEMQQGGLAYVPSQVTSPQPVQQFSPQQVNTYQTPSQSYTPMYTPPQQQFVPTAPTYENVTFAEVLKAPEAAPKLVDIINPTTGEKRTITFIPGATELPEGFVLSSEYTAPDAKATSVTPVVGQAQVREDTTSQRRKDEAAAKKADEDRARVEAAGFYKDILGLEPAKDFEDILGGLKPGTISSTGYIVGDNGERIDPVTLEQVFFGRDGVKFALKPEDKPPLNTEKEGGINRKIESLKEFRRESSRLRREKQTKEMADEYFATDEGKKLLDKAVKDKEKADAKPTRTPKQQAAMDAFNKQVKIAQANERAKKNKEKKDREKVKRITKNMSKEKAKSVKEAVAKQGGRLATGARAKGGLMEKEIKQPKQMRSGGLASKN